MPIDELRCRMNELPKNRGIYIYCQIGLRGYLASRILLQSGFDKVYNLSGGYRLWEVCTNETDAVNTEDKALIA
jgi:rhodanese-related sulfurtransferase